MDREKAVWQAYSQERCRKPQAQLHVWILLAFVVLAETLLTLTCCRLPAGCAGELMIRVGPPVFSVLNLF